MNENIAHMILLIIILKFTQQNEEDEVGKTPPQTVSAICPKSCILFFMGDLRVFFFFFKDNSEYNLIFAFHAHFRTLLRWGLTIDLIWSS